MTYYLTGNDLKCHLNLSDVHATGPKTSAPVELRHCFGNSLDRLRSPDKSQNMTDSSTLLNNQSFYFTSVQ